MSEADKAYGRGQVIDIINSVIHKIDQKGDTKREIYHYIAELSVIIESLKQDIASHRPEHVANSHIPDANDELDAVVEATAEATNMIMTNCEDIEALAQSLPEEQGRILSGYVTNIYEACTFQDITGQRIKKVVSTLREIEDRIDKIIKTLDQKVGPLKLSNERIEKKVSAENDASLLNGPQMPAKAISQDDIDKLLAEFDNP